MRHGLALGALLATLAVGPAKAADDPLALLAPEIAAAGHVDVTGAVEAGVDGNELVVRLRPTGEAKLVADPGIEVTSSAAAPVSRVLPGENYFPGPQEIRIPVTQDGPVRARVEYAYCIVDRQCLFGEANLQVEAPGS